MPEASPVNPYETPGDATAKPVNFSEATEEVADLRRRVAELEKRVNSAWVVHPNYIFRMAAIWAYWLLGYALVAAIAATIMFVMGLLSPRW